MKRIKKILPLSEAALSLNTRKKEVFLDIETTGFSPDRSRVYLVGACWREEDKLVFFQWLSENSRDEAELLLSASRAVEDASCLLTFNGDRFDLPFLEGRCHALGLESRFSRPESIDIFKMVKAGRKLLQLPNYKLKTIECFLGIEREDQMSGRELIKVYKEYESSSSPEAKKLLLLHNEEDILSMPSLLPMKAYKDLLQGRFSVCEITALEEEYEASDDAAFLVASLRLNRSLPQPVMISAAGICALFSKDRLRLTIPEYHGSLRYFFPDYKDYYYLPEEDMAIHKSVSGFVDKEHRIKAGRDRAYIRKDGHFLLIPARPAKTDHSSGSSSSSGSDHPVGSSSFSGSEHPVGSSSASGSGLQAQPRCFSRSLDGDLYLESADLELMSTDFWNNYLKLLISRI